MGTIHSRLGVVAMIAVMAMAASSCSEQPERHVVADDKVAENVDTITFGLRGDPSTKHATFKKLAKERFGADTEFVGHHLKEARSREVDEMNRKAIKAVVDKFGEEAFEKFLDDAGFSRKSLIPKENDL